jgi:putative oxidoreductase
MMNMTMSPAMLASKALIGRVALAAIFIILGFTKIGGFDGMVAYASAYNVPFPEVAIVLAVIIEFVGGIMIAVGWKTRWAAEALAVFLIVTTLFFHTDFSDQMQMTMFLKNLAIFGGVLLLLAHGPGKYSLDERMKKSAT